MVDNSGQFFRPIREEALSRSTLPSSPTTPLSPSSSNVTGRGGTRSDYRRSTKDYVDNNANNIRSAAFNKPQSANEDRLIQAIDKLQIDGSKTAGDGAESIPGSANHIGAAAVAPALLLANHISAPALLPNAKIPNGEIKSVS